jgi:ADP-heptose:LPS heptosyltransferase
VDFASTLMTDPATKRPGKGVLFQRLSKSAAPNAAQKALERPDRKLLVVSGSQDGLFPIEHFARLVEAVRPMGKVTAVVYQAENEELPVVDELEKQVPVVRVPGEAGGHALLFQDGVAKGFAKLLVNWITEK